MELRKFETVQGIVDYVKAVPSRADSRVKIEHSSYQDSYFLVEAPAYKDQASYRRDYHPVSKQLGKELYDKWAKRPVYKGSKIEDPAGYMKLSSVIKRLDASIKIDKIVSDAKKEQQAQLEQRIKESNKKEMRELLSRIDSLKKDLDICTDSISEIRRLVEW